MSLTAQFEKEMVAGISLTDTTHEQDGHWRREKFNFHLLRPGHSSVHALAATYYTSPAAARPVVSPPLHLPPVVA